MRLREVLPYAFYVASALVLLWDVFLAGQIAQLRRAPRFFRAVTALGGLLIAPATLVAVTSASILNGRARAFVTGSGRAIGRPALRAGGVIELAGVGKTFDGKYYVVQSTHLYGEDGYHTSFRVRRNAVG